MRTYKKIMDHPSAQDLVRGTRKIRIEYLYLDLNTCDRCVGTEHLLSEVISKLTPALELAGYQVAYGKKEMIDADTAIRYRFLSSPTIRVNGRDVNTEVKENNCGCCGDISGCDVDCRVFELDGKTYEIPPESVLADALLRTIFAPPKRATKKTYQFPQNLVDFYAGKEAQTKA
jgi:hypothetical protein